MCPGVPLDAGLPRQRLYDGVLHDGARRAPLQLAPRLAHRAARHHVAYTLPTGISLIKNLISIIKNLDSLLIIGFIPSKVDLQRTDKVVNSENYF